MCVCYKLSDGTTQTIVHQKVTELNSSTNIKESAEKFK